MRQAKDKQGIDCESSSNSFIELFDQYEGTHNQTQISSLNEGKSISFYNSQLNQNGNQMNAQIEDSIKESTDIRKLSKFSSKNQETHKSKDLEALGSILKYYFSVGVLTLPYMYFLSGYLLGSLLIITVTVMTIISVRMVHAVSEDMCLKNPSDEPTHSLGDISLRVLGPIGQFLYRAFSSISNTGSCVAYMVFFEMYIASILKEQWSHNIQEEQANLVSALCAFVIVLPLSLINSVALFSHTNFIGLFAGLTALGIMVYSELGIMLNTGGIHIEESDLWKPENFEIAMGIVVFSFKIMGISMIVRSNMEKPQNFPKVFNIATLFTCIIFLLFGIVTQLAFDEYTAEIVLLNFAPGKFIGALVRLLFTISVLLSYPLKFYVLIVLYENFSCFKENIFCSKKEYNTLFEHNFALLKRYAVRFFLIFIIFVFTLVTHKIAKIISLVGSVGGIINQFVFPQIIYVKYFNNLSNLRIFSAIFISLTCIAVSFLGAYQSLKGLWVI